MVLRKIFSDIKREKGRFIKFCVVGGSGVAVNLFFVWLGNAYAFAGMADNIKTPLAYALGIVTSIFTNFILNYIWTWGDVEKKGTPQFFMRLLKYYIVSAVAALIQFAVSNALVFAMKYYATAGTQEIHVLWKLLFACAGIVAGMLINFFMNHYWTFKK